MTLVGSADTSTRLMCWTRGVRFDKMSHVHYGSKDSNDGVFGPKNCN